MPANGSTIDANRRPNIIKHNEMMKAVFSKLTPEERTWLSATLAKHSRYTQRQVKEIHKNNASLQRVIKLLMDRIDKLERTQEGKSSPTVIRSHNIFPAGKT